MHANFVWNIDYILALHENYAYYYFRQTDFYVSAFTFQWLKRKRWNVKVSLTKVIICITV